MSRARVQVKPRASAAPRARNFGRMTARLAGLLCCIGASQCIPPRPQPAPRQVVLIVVESLRPDALGCYGSLSPSPAIDRFATGNTVRTAYRYGILG